MNYLIIDNLNYLSEKLFERQYSDCWTAIITSYINNTGKHKADISENDFSSNYTNFDTIIIRVNEDNIRSALRFKSSIYEKAVYFLSINENLYDYLPKDMQKKYVNFDEKNSLHANLQILSNVLNIHETTKPIDINTIQKCSIDYTQKCMNVSIGNGCDRKCSFCSISGTNVNYYPLEYIIAEIKSNLENGIQYFHINNHNFSSDLQYVRKFCNSLIKECGHLDYKWSCFIIPESIISDSDVLFLMKEAKVDRIELGVENINNSIQSDFELIIQKNHIINIIDVCQIAEISSIVVNYIIGSPNESEETLQKSKEFIEMLIQKTSGKLDLNLSFFYPDMETKYDNYQTLQERQSIINKCVKRKQSCLMDTKYLSKMDIYLWKWNLTKQINSDKLQFISKLTPKERINICVLFEYGIKTQIWKHLFNTSVTYLFDQKRMFDKRNSRNISFFFEEIETCIESYTPRLVSENQIFVDSSNNIFIRPDLLFLIDKSSPPINISEFELYKSMLSELSIRDIFAINCENANDDRTIKSIVKKLKELENVHLIYYIQILK